VSRGERVSPARRYGRRRAERGTPPAEIRRLDATFGREPSHTGTCFTGAAIAAAPLAAGARCERFERRSSLMLTPLGDRIGKACGMEWNGDETGRPFVGSPGHGLMRPALAATAPSRHMPFASDSDEHLRRHQLQVAADPAVV
jgi:hypothetical protein